MYAYECACSSTINEFSTPSARYRVNLPLLFARLQRASAKNYFSPTTRGYIKEPIRAFIIRYVYTRARVPNRATEREWKRTSPRFSLIKLKTILSIYFYNLLCALVISSSKFICGRIETLNIYVEADRIWEGGGGGLWLAGERADKLFLWRSRH